LLCRNVTVLTVLISLASNKKACLTIYIVLWTFSGTSTQRNYTTLWCSYYV